MSEKREGGMNLRSAVTLLATPRASDGERGGPNQRSSRGVYDALPSQVQPARFGKYAEAIAHWEALLGVLAPDPTEPTGRDGAPRLSPRFAAWMMGLHDIGLCDEGSGLSRRDQLKAIGNAVAPKQAEYAITGLLARAKSNGFKPSWEA